ncbi:acyl carrier protein [Actinoplanes sp. G11-F43]|uniref:acyl carrier protein n=1 Tax=Actinoplanes sp. G11-F43 TaxID=3424130 RepID=UPI003D340387
MSVTSAENLDEVRDLLVTTLGIEDRAGSLTASSPLLDGLPELDSMAVLEIVAGLEERFGIVVDDDEVTAELFETLGSLAEFVQVKRA